MKKNTIYYILVAVVFVAIVGYYVYTKTSKKNSPSPSPSPNVPDSSNNKSNGTSVMQNLIFPIKKGDAGEHVKRLQIALNYINKEVKAGKIAKIDEDGKFGAGTETRLVLMYGNKTVNQTLAEKIAKDSGIPGIASNWISSIK